jgi:FAD synthase
MWYRRKVQMGKKLGRKLGYPTLNFNVGSFGTRHCPAVYSSEVKIKGKIYKGALFYGPKLKRRGRVLEVHVLDFSDDLYGQFVSFKVGQKIRKPMAFASLDELKNQIRKDVESLV